MVIDLGDAASSRFAGALHHRLEVSERICLGRVLRHLIAQPPVDLSGSFTQHIAGDVGVDVQCSRRRYMAQHGGEGLVSMPFSSAMVAKVWRRS